MSYEKLAIIFDIKTLKLFKIQRYITDIDGIKNTAKEHQVVDG